MQSKSVELHSTQLSLLPYSAKFLRRIIFLVFADPSRTAKIKFLETFQLNCSVVRGMVWKQNNRYSAIAWTSEQHSTLSFLSERFQIPGGHLRRFLRSPLRLSLGRRLCLRSVVGELQRTKPRRLQTKFAPEQKHLDPEASS